MSRQRKPLTADDPRHGTYAGAMAHRYHRVASCDACREAFATYMRERRQNDPAVLKASRERTAATSRALHRLRAMHDAEYRALYIEELGKRRTS